MYNSFTDGGLRPVSNPLHEVLSGVPDSIIQFFGRMRKAIGAHAPDPQPHALSALHCVESRDARVNVERRS
jgi:hypothetical protein